MIELRDVTVAYPGTPSPAVEAVSCRFPDASVTALVGASGSGKTTVLRTVNRMVTPTAGTVSVDGRDVADLDAVELRRYPGELSGGQAQRVGMARALAHDPRILLMDEPFGPVDPVVRRSLQDLLAELQSWLRKTVVLVTHDMSEAFRLADRILLLSAGGRIEQAGTRRSC
ncbi:ATP-binding cassette domain-containing protein [Corynebacterium frankenforstense]